MDDLLTEMRTQRDNYAQQRDNHAQEASRLQQAAETHRVASHQFAGAHDALVALIARLEAAPAPAVPEASNGQ